MSVVGKTQAFKPDTRALAGAELPVRVRNILETLLRAASKELEARLEGMLLEFEQQLFRLADHARNPGVESGYLHTLRTMRLNRADLIPRFMVGIEAGLASLDRRQPVSATQTELQSEPLDFARLALVDETDMDAELIVRDIAQRSAAKASLPLHLLGQRFGVLAAAPAFDAERLPLGPHALCASLQEASTPLQLPPEAQQLLLRTFERKVMADYGAIVDMLNVELATAGVLPALTYVPLRVRPASAGEQTEDAHEGADGTARPAWRARDANNRQGRPHSAWLTRAQADPADGGDADTEAGFAMLQDLLAGKRRTRTQHARGGAGPATRAISPEALASALAQVRSTLALSGLVAPTIEGLREEVLTHLREQHGPDAALSRAENDTFSLLGMLYERVQREVRTETLAANLLQRLQLPVLQTALSDRAFFTSAQHPARQLLGTVADSGARWLGDGDTDPQLLQALQRAVEYVVRHAHEDATAFDTSNRLLQQELQQQARRSEAAERRHVEAARGKEKLHVAKTLAASTIAGMIGERQPPKFVRALVEQSWADVLTLTLLRGGEDSDDWRQMVDTTRRIVAACCDDTPVSDPALSALVESALARVGYHAAEAAAISERLTSAPHDGDTTSRTELAAVLKARTRFGDGAAGAPATTKQLAPRTADEQAQYERVRVLPFGTWIDFTTNQQGDVVRRRLSWYSLVTDNALFVNLRGQRVGEQSLDTLARMLALGQARIVTVESAGVVDRAWQATLSALRGLVRRGGKGAHA